ncbi:MAG: L,D-transpeptidase [Patescibacteria group bacterium]
MARFIGFGLLVGITMLLLGGQVSKAYLSKQPIVVKVQKAPIVTQAKTSAVSASVIVDSPPPVKETFVKTNASVNAMPTAQYVAGIEKTVGISSSKRSIVISIAKQRLYAYESENLKWVMVCSTASTGTNLPPDENMDEIHNHIGLFSVLGKQKNRYSILAKVAMPFALHYHGGHYIHATQETGLLGTPASHGCVRLRHSDAKQLFEWAKVDDQINIIL